MESLLCDCPTGCWLKLRARELWVLADARRAVQYSQPRLGNTQCDGQIDEHQVLLLQCDREGFGRLVSRWWLSGDWVLCWMLP